MSEPKEFDEIIHCERIGDSLLYNHYVVGELVRCKDCKYSTPLTVYDKGVKGLFCNYRGSIGDWRYRTTGDFCSRAERKDKAEE